MDYYNEETIKVRNEEKLLLLVYLVSCLISNIPYPIGLSNGEKGVAKITTLKIVKKLIEPTILETMTFLKNNEELIRLLSHHRYANFHNISNINTLVSDTLCRAATGEYYAIAQALEGKGELFFKQYAECVNKQNQEVI